MSSTISKSAYPVKVLTSAIISNLLSKLKEIGSEKNEKVGRKSLSLQKIMKMKSKLIELARRYRTLGIDRQLDYDKFYLFSITHSTAIDGLAITEIESQIMFHNSIALKRKRLVEAGM